MARSNAKTNVAPEQVAPEQSAPEQSAPEQVAPEQVAPEQVASEQVAPEQSAPEQNNVFVVPFTMPELSVDTVTRIPLERIRLNPDNVSHRFDPAREEDADFLRSISSGAGELITPVTVVPNDDGETYTVIRGNRRISALRVMVERGESVPWVRAMLHPEQDHVAMLYDMERSNTQSPLSQYQAGELYARLREEGQTVAQIMFNTGRSDRHIETCLHLATAPAWVKDLWATGRISETLSGLIYAETGGVVSRSWAKAEQILKAADAHFPQEEEKEGKKVPFKITLKALEAAQINGKPIWLSAKTLKKMAREAEVDRLKKEKEAADKQPKQPEQPEQPEQPKQPEQPDATKQPKQPDATKQPEQPKPPVTPPAPSEPKMVLCYESEGTNVFHIRNTGKREATAYCVAANPGNAQRTALALNFLVSFGPDSGYRVVKK